MSKTTTSGKDLIREAVRARANVVVIMARDCGVSIDLLDSFAHGRADLPLDILQAIVKFIWSGHIEYNAEADKLRPREQPPARSIGICPTLNIDALRFTKVTPGPPPRGPQPVVAAPKPKQRPGWIGGVWK